MDNRKNRVSRSLEAVRERYRAEPEDKEKEEICNWKCVRDWCRRRDAEDSQLEETWQSEKTHKQVREMKSVSY